MYARKRKRPPRGTARNQVPAISLSAIVPFIRKNGQLRVLTGYVVAAEAELQNVVAAETELANVVVAEANPGSFVRGHAEGG